MTYDTSCHIHNTLLLQLLLTATTRVHILLKKSPWHRSLVTLPSCHDQTSRPSASAVEQSTHENLTSSVYCCLKNQTSQIRDEEQTTAVPVIAVSVTATSITVVDPPSRRHEDLEDRSTSPQPPSLVHSPCRKIRAQSSVHQTVQFRRA